MPPRVHSDEQVCDMIWQIRQVHGACTLGELVRATGQTKQAVASRLRTLERRGLVYWDADVHGSIRTADEQRSRVGRKVRRRRGGFTLLGGSGHAVSGRAPLSEPAGLSSVDGEPLRAVEPPSSGRAGRLSE